MYLSFSQSIRLNNRLDDERNYLNLLLVNIPKQRAGFQNLENIISRPYNKFKDFYYICICKYSYHQQKDIISKLESFFEIKCRHKTIIVYYSMESNINFLFFFKYTTSKLMKMQFFDCNWIKRDDYIFCSSLTFFCLL